jgi:orotate phosphoribosyltransferase
VQQRYGLPVVSIASLNDILALLDDNAEFAEHREAVLAYRARYGI